MGTDLILTAEQLLTSIWAALRRIEDNLSLPPAPLELPAPVIHVPAPDLADLVNAVTSLNGTGPTAEEIARALADVLAPTPGGLQLQGADVLGEVARALEKLDFRLQGVGPTAVGGGSVTLQPGQAEAIGNAVQPTTNTTYVARVLAQTTPVILGTHLTERAAMTVYSEPASSVLYLKFGPDPSTTSYSTRLGPGDYWESAPPRYTGVVTAVWDGTTGAALVTEFVST